MRDSGAFTDYAKMPKVRIIDASDLGDIAVFWFCAGVFFAAVCVFIWEQT